MNLPAPKPIPFAAALLGAVLAFCGTPAVAGPGPMQVEEPETEAIQPPIQPDKDGEGWKSRKNATLTAAQQAALETRQETMKDMMALIQQKRLAIREARPEDRQALAQELHALILEQSQGADRSRSRAAARKNAKSPGEGGPAANARTRGDALDLMGRSLEQKAERLRQQESHRQAVEEKLKQLEEQLEDKSGSGGKKSDE